MAVENNRQPDRGSDKIDENAIPPAAPVRSSRWVKLLNYFSLIAMIFLAVFSITEVAERTVLDNRIEAKIDGINEQLAEISKSPGSSVAPAAPPNFQSDADAEEYRRYLLAISQRFSQQNLEANTLQNTKRVYQRHLETLRDLQNNGSNSISFTRHGILCELNNRLYDDKGCKESLYTGLAYFIRSSEWLVVFYRYLNFSWYLSSETLLALIVIFCGGIGALIGGLRSEQGYATLRPLMLGVASGFVAYLAIKGGKFVFVLHLPDGSLPENPYGVAFAGILVGLFTETAYDLLRHLVEDIVERIKSAMRSGNGDNGDKPPPTSTGDSTPPNPTDPSPRDQDTDPAPTPAPVPAP